MAREWQVGEYARVSPHVKWSDRRYDGRIVRLTSYIGTTTHGSSMYGGALLPVIGIDGEGIIVYDDEIAPVTDEEVALELLAGG